MQTKSTDMSDQRNNIYLGVEIGDHTVDYGRLIEELKRKYDISKLGFVLIYTKPVDIPQVLWLEWASFFKENGIRFAFLYTQQRGAPKGKDSHLTSGLVNKIKDIAGDYFIGDMIGETGGLASWPEGYYEEFSIPKPEFKNLDEAKRNYVEHVKTRVELDRKLEVPAVLCVEATLLGRYNFEAGVDYGFAEMMCGNPEIILAGMRGASKAYGKDWWGCHIAHEWYGGYRNDDPLKYKRLKLAYYYAFMSGARYIYPESGDFSIQSYGYEYGSESECCNTYRKCWNDFADFIRIHKRPQGQPLTTLGILQGNLDGWTGWGGSTVWNRFGDETWAFGASENGWDYLEELHKRKKWHNPTVYGQCDETASLPFGIYDIIPVEASVEVLRQYGCLVCLGWNTMTQEAYEKLKEYVFNGGRLFMAVPQLCTSKERETQVTLLNSGDFSDLFGCRIKGEGKRLNSGVKFINESQMPGLKYPYTSNGECDPICAAGYIQCAEAEVTSARIIAILADMFFGWKKDSPPVLLENAYGKGFATLLTTVDYPGSTSLRKLMPVLLNAMLCSEKGRVEPYVLAGDSVYHAVYRWGDGYVLYLLNTDYNVPNHVQVLYHGMEVDTRVESCEMKVVYLAEDAICFAESGRFNMDYIKRSDKGIELSCSSAEEQKLYVMMSHDYRECLVNGKSTVVVRDGGMVAFSMPKEENMVILLY